MNKIQELSAIVLLFGAGDSPLVINGQDILNVLSTVGTPTNNREYTAIDSAHPPQKKRSTIPRSVQEFKTVQRNDAFRYNFVQFIMENNLAPGPYGSRLATRTANSLINNGISTMEELNRTPQNYLEGIRQIGASQLEVLASVKKLLSSSISV